MTALPQGPTVSDAMDNKPAITSNNHTPSKTSKLQAKSLMPPSGAQDRPNPEGFVSRGPPLVIETSRTRLLTSFGSKILFDAMNDRCISNLQGISRFWLFFAPLKDLCGEAESLDELFSMCLLGFWCLGLRLR